MSDILDAMGYTYTRIKSIVSKPTDCENKQMIKWEQRAGVSIGTQFEREARISKYGGKLWYVESHCEYQWASLGTNEDFAIAKEIAEAWLAGPLSWESYNDKKSTISFPNLRVEGD
jgi:hypothetical protein